MVEANVEQLRRDLLQDIAELEKKIKVLEVELGISVSSVQELNAGQLTKVEEINLVPMKTLSTVSPMSINVVSNSSLSTVNIPKKSDIGSSQQSFISAVKNSIANDKNKLSALNNLNAQQNPPIKDINSQNRTVLNQNIQVNSAQQVKQPVQNTPSNPAAQTVSNIPSYGPQDIPSLALLIKRIGDLIETNTKIANDLSDILVTTKSLNYSSKMSSLLNKLANVAING